MCTKSHTCTCIRCLYSVFPLTPPDQIELRHALANMVAAVLACPPQSNHLWYHLFAANELNGTHMTAFMVRVRSPLWGILLCALAWGSDWEFILTMYVCSGMLMNVEGFSACGFPTGCSSSICHEDGVKLYTLKIDGRVCDAFGAYRAS